MTCVLPFAVVQYVLPCSRSLPLVRKGLYLARLWGCDPTTWLVSAWNSCCMDITGLLKRWDVCWRNCTWPPELTLATSRFVLGTNISSRELRVWVPGLNQVKEFLLVIRWIQFAESPEASMQWRSFWIPLSHTCICPPEKKSTYDSVLFNFLKP